MNILYNPAMSFYKDIAIGERQAYDLDNLLIFLTFIVAPLYTYIL